MKLLHIASGEFLDASIEEIKAEDLGWIEKSKAFSFDWSTEREYEVYKIYVREDDRNILGIMSLIDRPDEYRMHLNLLEVSLSNQGRQKKIGKIAGCLIAFAVEQAFKRGYYGFVSLEPKTRLIDHYHSHYGFIRYGRYLGIEGQAAQLLIEKYLGDE